MKPHIKKLEKGHYECSCDTWRGWGWSPEQAYNDWLSWSYYGGICA